MRSINDRTRHSGGVDMPTLVGPFNVGFPVNFTSGGDTTRDAFSKHIQEIERIYGYLNALDAGKVSASDVSGLSGSIGSINTALANHINSTNPHPNYKPSWSDLTGTKPNLTDFSGSLPMSRITGNLDASRITNLPSSGDGITEDDISGNGYVKFNNGLIIQWGRCTMNRSSWNEGSALSASFPIAFSTQCYTVIAGTEAEVPDSGNSAVDCIVQVKDITNTGFKYLVQEFYRNSAHEWTKIHCNYMAIGK